MKSVPTPIDRSAALLGLVVVVLANVRYLAGLSAILDPAMSMEPFYIDMAQRPVFDILAQNPAWGTLYALWLKPFRALLTDPLRVYSANVYALSFALSVSVYLYTLLLTRRAAIATGTALFILISDFNVPLSSKVCAFALIVVLVGLTLSELESRSDRRMAIVAGGVLLASYARPELYVSGLSLWIAAIWLARRDLVDLRRATRGWVVGGTGLIVAIAWWVGTPVWSGHHQGGRLLDAFREHFAWNWMRWNGKSDYYLAIWRREFGAADSIVGAYLENPGAVVRHVGNNLIGVLRSLFGTTYDHYPLLASSTWPALVRMEALAFSVGSLVCIAAVAARRELREKALQRYRHVLFVFLALAIFPIGGGTLIYPSVHYLIVPALCLFLIGVLAISLLLPHVRGGSPGWRGLIVVLTLAAIPTPFVLPTEYFDPGKAPVGSLSLTRNVTDAVELIRSLELAEPVHVLTFTDGIGELLGAGFHEVKIWRRGERPLKEYLADEHIDVIVTMEPGQRSFLVDDPYWETIQIEPAAAGFAPVTTPSGAAVARIWVRADLRKESVGTGDATAR